MDIDVPLSSRAGTNDNDASHSTVTSSTPKEINDSSASVSINEPTVLVDNSKTTRLRKKK
jgi:hypothetical protein